MVADFKSVHNGHEVTARVHSDGSVSFLTDAIQEVGKYYSTPKEFKSLTAIQAALDKYELASRKDFTNKTAYVIHGGYGREGEVEEVTVTSLTETGNAAWIKTSKGERRQLRLETLYSSRKACEAYVRSLAAAFAVFEREKVELLSALNRFVWTPEGTPEVDPEVKP